MTYINDKSVFNTLKMEPAKPLQLDPIDGSFFFETMTERKEREERNRKMAAIIQHMADNEYYPDASI